MPDTPPLEGEYIGRGPDSDASDCSHPEAIQEDMFESDPTGDAEDLQHPLVYKRNEIIHGRFTMRTLPMKVFSAILSKIDPRATDFAPINISRTEMARMVKISRQSIYELADAITTELKQVILTVPYIDKDWEESVKAERISAARENRLPRNIPKPKPGDRESFAKVSLFDVATYNAEAGMMTFKFNDRLKDYLIDLRGNFTYYQLRTILPMSSGHAIRIYEILRSALSLKAVQSGTLIAYKTIHYQELRDILKISSKAYPKFAHFERAVLHKAQEQMQGGDLGFTYTLPERVNGNRQTPVKTIRFKIFAISTQEGNDDWKLTFTQIFTDNARKKLMEELSLPRLQRNIEYYQTKIEDGTKITKPSSWLRQAFKKDYAGIDALKSDAFASNAIQSGFIKDQLLNAWLTMSDADRDEFLENGFDPNTGIYLLFEGYQRLRKRQEAAQMSPAEKRASITQSILNPDFDF